MSTGVKTKLIDAPQVPLNSSVDLNRFLLELADTLNSTLDLDTILNKVAEQVRRVIPFEIFAILLVNEKTQDLRLRFQIGHAPEVEKIRIKLGTGVTGTAAQKREAVLQNDISACGYYIMGHSGVQSELAVPLIAKNKVIGVIDIQSVEKNFFTEDHKRLLTVVASRIAVAIENARLYTRVYRQAQTLQILNEISRELTSILNTDQLLKRIGELLARVIDYQMFSVLLVDEQRHLLEHRFSLRFKESIQIKHDIPIGKGLVGAAAAQREPVVVPDVSKDPRYIMLNPETRSELCVPLIYKDKVIGVLDLENTRRGYFNEENMRTVTTLAAQIAIAMENARLYERITREEQRLERDLAMARELQQRLLPPSCPVLAGSQISAKFLPAHAIGGDIYDFVHYSGGRVGIAVGDVSGKGAPAALFAALVGGIIRSTASLEPAPSEMLSAINTSLNERHIDAQYVAMIYAIWDDERRVMQIANSGQPRPIYCHHGKTQIVEAAGIPLGLLDDSEYDEVTLHAHPGDAFVFFSDGIIDAVNRDGELFGRARVEEIVRKNHAKPADDMVIAIFSEVKRHAGDAKAFDDETVVVVKLRSGENKPEVAKRSSRKTSPAQRTV